VFVIVLHSIKMRLEITSAANFLVHLMGDNLKMKDKERFRKSLIQVLHRRYRDHWMPDRPIKGSGFRVIRIREGYFDMCLGRACAEAYIPTANVRKALPPNIMLYIDPFEVTYRLGDFGCEVVIYSYKEDQINVPWQAPPTLPNPATKWFCCC
jgi:protein Tob/BTG